MTTSGKEIHTQIITKVPAEGDVVVRRILGENCPPQLEEREFTFRTKKITYEGQTFPKDIYTKWFDYDKIKNDVLVRTRAQEDYMTIRKTAGSTAAGNTTETEDTLAGIPEKQLGIQKLKDVFKNEKVRLDERDRVLLLADGSHVMWIIGTETWVGKRISEEYKVAPETKNIWEISFVYE